MAQEPTPEEVLARALRDAQLLGLSGARLERILADSERRTQWFSTLTRDEGGAASLALPPGGSAQADDGRVRIHLPRAFLHSARAALLAEREQLAVDPLSGVRTGEEAAVEPSGSGPPPPAIPPFDLATIEAGEGDSPPNRAPLRTADGEDLASSRFAKMRDLVAPSTVTARLFEQTERMLGPYRALNSQMNKLLGPITKVDEVFRSQGEIATLSGKLFTGQSPKLDEQFDAIARAVALSKLEGERFASAMSVMRTMDAVAKAMAPLDVGATLGHLDELSAVLVKTVAWPEDPWFDGVKSTLASFAEAQQTLFDLAEHARPPTWTGRASTELFAAVDLAVSIAGLPGPTEAEAARTDARRIVITVARVGLDERLALYGADLVAMLHGARDALSAPVNRDRARHVGTSLRECFNLLLKKLAPDDDVLDWTRNPEHRQPSGKPTRKARLEYIIRDVSLLERDLLEADVSSFDALFKVLNATTHETVPEEMLPRLLTRVEGLLHMLLDVTLKGTPR